MHEIFIDGGQSILIGPDRPDVNPTTLRKGVRPFDLNNLMSWPPGVDSAFMGERCILTIRATGTIGSGVFLTGQTDPDGWPNFPADTPDWLLRNSPNAWRYGLIGALSEVAPDMFDPDSAEWFVIGKGPVTRVGTLGMAPKRLYLACNRPPLNGPDGGDGSWSVFVSCKQYDSTDLPDCSMTPPMTNPVSVRFCAAARAILTADDGPGQLALLSCNHAHDVQALIGPNSIGLGVAVSLLAADIGILGVLGGGAIMGVSHSIHAPLTAAQAAIGLVIGGGAGLAGSALVALAAELSSALAALAIACATIFAAAAGLAIAAAAAMTANWAFAAGVAITVLFGLGLLAAVIYLAGEINAEVADMVEARSQFDRHFQDWTAARAAAVRFCCVQTLSDAELTPPSCM
jgi:hypothetical protein